MSEDEKNSIREQHTGGMNVMVEKFNRLLKTKSGDVKPLINEQHKEPVKTYDPSISKLNKSTSIDESLKLWGKQIAGQLKGLQIMAYEVDYNQKPKGNSKSYFIDGVDDTAFDLLSPIDVNQLYDIKDVTIIFNGHVLNNSRTSEKVRISVRFTMSKGYAVGVEDVMVFGEPSKNLSSSDFAKEMIPIIGKTPLKNPCFDGYTYFKNGGTSSISGLETDYEMFEKNDTNNSIRLYKDKGNWVNGSGQIIPNNIESGGKLQNVSWGCSNGKLTISKR